MTEIADLEKQLYSALYAGAELRIYQKGTSTICEVRDIDGELIASETGMVVLAVIRQALRKCGDRAWQARRESVRCDDD